IPSVTKMKVVPPSISRGSRGWCVSTKTGVWNGGLSPHQPFQGGSSLQGPGPPPNMFRPITLAPTFDCSSSTTGVLALTSPPSWPCGLRHASSSTIHSWRSSPPTPSGFSSLSSGPAEYPSSETASWNLIVPIEPLLLVSADPRSPTGVSPGLELYRCVARLFRRDRHDSPGT